MTLQKCEPMQLVDHWLEPERSLLRQKKKRRTPRMTTWWAYCHCHRPAKRRTRRSARRFSTSCQNPPPKSVPLLNVSDHKEVRMIAHFCVVSKYNPKLNKIVHNFMFQLPKVFFRLPGWCNQWFVCEDCSDFENSVLLDFPERTMILTQRFTFFETWLGAQVQEFCTHGTKDECRKAWTSSADEEEERPEAWACHRLGFSKNYPAAHGRNARRLLLS